MGDWFNTVALYTLVRDLTGSPFALGLVFVTKMLPFALASPVAGALVDRFNRRRLMIATDLARALVVAAFLVIDEVGELPLLYGLISLQVVLGAVFIPARSASIPNITSDRELLTANALGAATWSSILAIGAALGGFATELLGVRAVFLLDALSYLVSALFIFRTPIPQETAPARAGAPVATALTDIAAGWRHMLAEPAIGRIAFAKAGWALGGGALVYMLALLGEELYPAAPAIGVGILYSARGVGTGVGPVAARAWVPDERHWPTLLGLGIAASGLIYLAIGGLPWSPLPVVLLVLLAHAPGGANWVFSTVMLQRRTEDRYRGRVFATEWLLVTFADTLAILAAAALLESGLAGLRGAILAFAALQIASGLAWMLLVVPAERRALRRREGRLRAPRRAAENAATGEQDPPAAR